jgi:uncharacterized protein involved in exopolysaccharide biosynthesis
MSIPTTSRFNRYLTVILRWLLITFVVFVLTVLGGGYITNNWLQKVYTATARIQIRPMGVIGLPRPDPNFHPAAFQAEFEFMQSPDFLLPVIYDLGLDKAWAKRVDQSGVDALSSPDALLPQDALAYMHKILKLDFVRGTNIINITASSDVPKEAAAIANAIADRYKTMRDVEEDQRTSRGEDSLRDQIARQQKIVDERKAAVEKMRQELGRSHHIIARPGDPNDQTKTDLQPFRDAQRELEQQQDLLDALNVGLKQADTNRQLRESPVRIISRAEAPTVPTKPNKSFAYIVTVLVAGFLSVMTASFVEVVFLFLRAAEKPDN